MKTRFVVSVARHCYGAGTRVAKLKTAEDHSVHRPNNQCRKTADVAGGLLITINSQVCPVFRTSYLIFTSYLGLSDH